jgi:hypothetical protein
MAETASHVYLRAGNPDSSASPSAFFCRSVKYHVSQEVSGRITATSKTRSFAQRAILFAF